VRLQFHFLVLLHNALVILNPCLSLAAGRGLRRACRRRDGALLGSQKR
jgi:hypothetical protein